MIRILFTYVAPFLLPIAVYAGWVWYRTGYVARHGGKAPKFEQGPWPLLLFLGVVLTFTIMGTAAMMRGESAGSAYEPAHIESGKIVPGHLDPAEH